MVLKEEVLNQIAETLDVSVGELKEGRKLYDSVGVDSTEMVELTVSLSKHFGVAFESNEITNKSTPLEITAVIKKKKQG